MHLTILGCFSPYAPANGACSGYLIQKDGLNIMLDCGHGAFAQLQRYINFRHLNALIISHFHPDHYADIHAIRHAISGAMRDGSRTERLIVYCPTEPKKNFEEISGWQDVFMTIPLEEAVQQEKVFGKINLEFFPTNHSITCFGVSLVADGKKITYTSDTAWAPEIVQYSSASDVILAEASLREVDIAYTSKGHLTAGQAATIAQMARAKSLILTHLWPEYNLIQLKREAEANFDGPVELAEMGKVFNVE